jgi:fatty acid desaturase
MSSNTGQSPGEQSGSKDMLGISMAEARSLVADLAARRQWIYWVDLIVSVVVGYAAFVLCPASRPLSPAALGCVVIAGLALYRAVLFVHEIVHAEDELRWFSLVWHAVCGIPLLVPRFMYAFHLEHHGSRTYGTAADGEYVPFRLVPRWRVIALPFTTALLAPLVFVVRFLVLAPLSWLIPPVRTYVLTRATTMAIDTDFYRKLPPAGVPRSWLVEEFACFAYLVGMLTLLAFGAYSPYRLLEAYMIASLVLFVNWIRLLAAHRYESGNQRMTFPEQILDSIDHPSLPVLGELWAPLGQRLHAVHHLFPKLPYHQLGEARRRLAAAIPRDRGYWATEDPSLSSSIKRLLTCPRPPSARSQQATTQAV